MSEYKKPVTHYSKQDSVVANRPYFHFYNDVEARDVIVLLSSYFSDILDDLQAHVYDFDLAGIADRIQSIAKLDGETGSYVIAATTVRRIIRINHLPRVKMVFKNEVVEGTEASLVLDALSRGEDVSAVEDAVQLRRTAHIVLTNFKQEKTPND